MSQVAEVFRRPRTMLKIFYSSGDHQLFQKSLGIKFLYDWVIDRFHLLTGEAQLETEGEGLFQQNHRAKKAPGHISPAHFPSKHSP